ncbi:MAG TPA: hypothetical protein VEY95_11035 [Azospirillaceae bacterium]|nr:hypothetical protein [Azospirillaceae bacterium]
MMDGTSIAFAPLLPWTVLGPLFVLAAAVALLALVRRARGAVWRTLALAALALVLMNPSFVQEERSPIKDVAVIVVDQSPSQAIGDRRERTEKAVAALEGRLARETDLDVRVVRTQAGGEGAAPVDETRMVEALNRALADVPRRRLAGAVLITDGQVHDIPEGLRGLTDIGPVHTLLTGRRDEADRRLAVVQAPSYGTLDRPVSVTVRVEDQPNRQSTDAWLTVRRGADAPQRMRVPVGRDHRLELTLAHAGQNVFELEVEAGRDELTLANNRVAVVVNGVRDRLRVLLVSGEPHAGERTWRNILKSDPSVDLVHFTILRPPEKQDGTPIRELSLIAFPIRELFEIKLHEFDLVIFDRYRRRGILPNVYLQNIVDYVQRGGALLEASGAAFAGPMSLSRTPLGNIIPARTTGDVLDGAFKPQITDVGRRHPVTSGLGPLDPKAEPPWGRWFRQADVETAEGAVVMSGNAGRPLLVLNRVGEGRVAQLTSDQIWLWSRGFEGGGPQAELLRRLAHWLMKEPELEENDLRARVDGNRVTIERRTLEPDPRPVTLTQPSGETRQFTLSEESDGFARASFTASEPGIHRFTDGERTAFAVVGAVNPPELADVRTTAARLQPVADASGGGVLWLGEREDFEVRRTRPERDQSGRNWIGLRANGDYVVTGVNETPLMPALLVLVLVLGTLMVAWRREGR